MILGAAIIILILLRTYGKGRSQQEGFSSGYGLGGKGKELVIVKAKWCGHCKRAMPEFERLAAASPIKMRDGSQVTVRILDDKDNKSEVETLSVRGFPTILFIDGTNKMEYGGERTYEGVMGFLEKAM